MIVRYDQIRSDARSSRCHLHDVNNVNIEIDGNDDRGNDTDNDCLFYDD